MMLKDKVAVIYGAGGDIGGAVARAFAREGAKLFLSGRNLAKVKALAADITKQGGRAEAAQVNALDEPAIEQYVNAIAEKAGRIDISFSAISVSGELPDKAPLTELSADHFLLPLTALTQSNFLTARSAARRMITRKSGVILTVTGIPGRMGFPFVGGTASAYAAIEALTRGLSVELAPQGIRVVGLMPHAIPETNTIRESFARYAKAAGVSQPEFQARFETTTHLRRLTTLAELANAATFAASDQGSGITGTFLNLSGGAIAS